ncbi:RETRotransposon-like protein [Echinococcus granulosus]|uniref:RETRotransposon-like protein n=1 Tax=Echinococcus granulosus TaxID=6210 RepID=W6TZK8_ECHGR|nr:RETRotransposon-like protein [Echinococcus granulosus]EUB54173.1 RETRotransposon-like protein [Echinococcus granulosus]
MRPTSQHPRPISYATPKPSSILQKEPFPLIEPPWLTQIPKDDTDDICNALFEAAAIPLKNLDDLCAQLTHIPNDGEKNSVSFFLTRPIGQPPRGIPPPWRGDVNHLFEEMLRDEVIKPSKLPWAPPIAMVKKKDSKLQLCIDCRKLNAVTMAPYIGRSGSPP